MRREPQGFWIALAFLLLMKSPAFAFPPQSVELMPGYKAPDSASDGAVMGQLRYFIYFPSLYLATGIGVGHLSADANHQNLAIGSKIEATPVTLALKLTPPHPDWLPFYLEVGIDRLMGLDYELDPARVNTQLPTDCPTDISTGPIRCTATTFKKRTVGYHVGAGVETVFKSGFGIGLHYMYLSATPLERKTETSDGIAASTVVKDDIFELKTSIVSLILSYHF